MEFKEVVRIRYSCKKYSDRQVGKKNLDAILQAGRLAPTAKNSQPQHLYVCQSKEALDKIDQITPCRYGAPTAVLITYDRDMIYTYPGGRYSSGFEDIGIVGTHLVLAAADEGVDSCWINNFDADRASEVFGLPDNEQPVMILDLGYAAEGAGPLPNHDSRKELSDTVTFL
jgi:nitroreductase